jgi:hypothetical protein
VTPGIGLRLPSTTTPAMLRVAAGGGACGFAIRISSDSAPVPASTGIVRGEKPSAVTCTTTLVCATPASLNVPSAPVVADGPPSPTATVAFATGF